MEKALTAPPANDDKARAAILDIDFADASYIANPWAPLQRLQREAPVFFSETQRGWIVSRHADVKAVYSDPRFSSSRTEQYLRQMPSDVVAQIDAMRTFNALNVNRLNGRDHIRIRSLLMKAIDANTIRRIEDFVPDIIDMVLDRCEELVEFDFQKVVSEVVPASVMQRLLDLPDEYRPIIFDLASEYIAASSAPKLTPELLLRIDAVLRRANEMFATIIAEREKDLGDDLVSRLIHARDGLARLSHEEMLAQLNGLVIAGAETTANSLGTQINQIARDPALVERIRTHPENTLDIVLELLRYPGTIKCFTRMASEDIEFGGQIIRKGDVVYSMNMGANVDPDVFPDPFRIDPERPNLRDIMTFSPGQHHCIGHMQGKTVLVAFFRRAFARFDIEILEDNPPAVSSYMFYGFRSLRVRFTPRA